MCLQTSKGSKQKWKSACCRHGISTACPGFFVVLPVWQEHTNLVLNFCFWLILESQPLETQPFQSKARNSKSIVERNYILFWMVGRKKVSQKMWGSKLCFAGVVSPWAAQMRWTLFKKQPCAAAGQAARRLVCTRSTVRRCACNIEKVHGGMHRDNPGLSKLSDCKGQ